MITSTHKPKDVRIYHKESKSLAKRGFDVTILLMYNPELPKAEPKIRWLSVPKPRSRYIRFFMTFMLLLRAIFLRSNTFVIHDGEILYFAFWLRVFRPFSQIIYDSHEPLQEYISSKKWVAPTFRTFIKLIVTAYELF